MSARKTLLASLALTGALFAGAAQARTDWSINIGLPFPGVVVAPQPRVVYAEPAYVPAPAYYPAPVYVAPRAYHPARPIYYERDGRWDRHDSRRWDSDGDGVPNRYDRRDHNPRRW